MKHLILCLLLIVPICVLAQEKINPIKWKASLKFETSKKGKLILKAEIEEGWHLYGIKLPEGGPVPTSFEFPEQKGIKLKKKTIEESEKIVKHDEVFDMVLNYFEGEAIFTNKVKLREPKAFVMTEITFMLCNDKMCMPPSTRTFIAQHEVKTNN